MTSTDTWLDGADFAGFVRREEDALLRAAVLVRGELPRAEALVEEALAAVGRRWEQAAEEDPVTEVRRHLYRSAVADAEREGTRGLPATLGGAAGRADWAQRSRSAEEERRRGEVGRALGRLTPRQRAVLCLLALDGATVAEAARTLRVLPRTVRAEGRDALTVLTADLPDEHLRDGRADGPGVRWLLSSAVEDLPSPDRVESVVLLAQQGRASVRRRSLLVAGGVVGGGAATALVARWAGREPEAEPPPVGSPTLTTRTLDGVVVALAPTPPEEAALPLAPDRAVLGVPDPVGPGEPGAVEPLPGDGLALPVLALYLVHLDRGAYTPVVQVPDPEGRPVLSSIPVRVGGGPDPLGNLVSPTSISADRASIALPSSGAVVVGDVARGTWGATELRDPTLSLAGWAPGERLVVARGRDDAWVVDPDTGTVERAAGPVYPGRHELLWDGDTTRLRRYADDGGLTGEEEVPGPPVVPFEDTVSSEGGWVAAHAFLPSRYQEEVGRSQGVVALRADGSEPVRLLAASFPAGSLAIRYRVLRWAGDGRLLVESLADGGGNTQPQRRVLLWDVPGGLLHRVADVVGVGPTGSWFTGQWGL